MAAVALQRGRVPRCRSKQAHDTPVVLGGVVVLVGVVEVVGVVAVVEVVVDVVVVGVQKHELGEHMSLLEASLRQQDLHRLSPGTSPAAVRTNTIQHNKQAGRQARECVGRIPASERLR